MTVSLAALDSTKPQGGFIKAFLGRVNLVKKDPLLSRQYLLSAALKSE